MTVEFWRMGATPVPSTEIDRFAREFEGAGWDGLAVGEAHGLLPDPYIVLARAAAATTTLQAGDRGGRTASIAAARRERDGDAASHVGRPRQLLDRSRRRRREGAQAQAHARGGVRGLPRRDPGLSARRRRRAGRRLDLDGSRLRHRPVVADRRSRRSTSPRPGPRTIEVAAKTADGVSFSVGADVERLAQERRARSGRPATRSDVTSSRFGSVAISRSRSPTKTRARARRSAASS